MRVALLIAVTGCAGDPVDLPPPPGAGDPTVCPDGDCVPDPTGEEVRIGWAQVAVDPRGQAWVSWILVDGPAVTGLFVARSAGVGEPLSAPIEVPVAEPPNISVSEKPSLTVDEARIAIGYTGSGILRHGDAHVTYVQLGAIDAHGAVAFEPAIPIDTLSGWVPPLDAEEDQRVAEQARVAFAPDGELWALWKRQVYGTADFATWARESTGYLPTDLSPVLSRRHDCSPPDFRFGFGGGPLVALRSNIDGWLQTMAIVGDPETAIATGVTQVSSDAWQYNTEVCPEHGPRLVELLDGTLFAAWMAPSGVAWRLFSAWSTDGGTTWTEPAFDHDGVDLGEKYAAIAATDDGPFVTTVEGLDSRTRALVRGSPGAVPDERWLVGGDGLDLSAVEIAHGGGRTVAIGLGEGRVIWLVDL